MAAWRGKIKIVNNFLKKVMTSSLVLFSAGGSERFFAALSSEGVYRPSLMRKVSFFNNKTSLFSAPRVMSQSKGGIQSERGDTFCAIQGVIGIDQPFAVFLNHGSWEIGMTGAACASRREQKFLGAWNMGGYGRYSPVKDIEIFCSYSNLFKDPNSAQALPPIFVQLSCTNFLEVKLCPTLLGLSPQTLGRANSDIGKVRLFFYAFKSFAVAAKSGLLRYSTQTSLLQVASQLRQNQHRFMWYIESDFYQDRFFLNLFKGLLGCEIKYSETRTLNLSFNFSLQKFLSRGGLEAGVNISFRSGLVTPSRNISNVLFELERQRVQSFRSSQSTFPKTLPRTKQNLKTFLANELDLSAHAVGQNDEIINAFLKFQHVSSDQSSALVCHGKETLHLLKTDGTFFLVGPRNCGKKYLIAQICEGLGHPFIEIDAGLLVDDFFKKRSGYGKFGEDLSPHLFFQCLLKDIYKKVEASGSSNAIPEIYPVIFLDNMDQVITLSGVFYSHSGWQHDQRAWRSCWMQEIQSDLMLLLDRNAAKEALPVLETVVKKLRGPLGGGVVSEALLNSKELEALSDYLKKSLIFFSGEFSEQRRRNYWHEELKEGPLSDRQAQQFLTVDRQDESMKEFIGRVRFHWLDFPANEGFVAATLNFYRKKIYESNFEKTYSKKVLNKVIPQWQDLPQFSFSKPAMEKLVTSLQEYQEAEGLGAWYSVEISKLYLLLEAKTRALFDYSVSKDPFLVIKKPPLPKKIIITLEELPLT